MEITVHTLEDVFETAMLFALLFYWLCWFVGRKLTNVQALLLFSIGFAGFLLIKLVSPMPTYVFLIVCVGPSVLFRLWDRGMKRFRSRQKSAI